MTSVEPCSSEHPQHTGRQVGGNCRIMGPKALVVRVIPAQGTYSTLGDKWEISLESGGPKHPHLSSKAENQAPNLERVDPAQSPGEGDN